MVTIAAAPESYKAVLKVAKFLIKTNEGHTSTDNRPQILKNAKQGKHFEQVVGEHLKANGHTDIAPQVTVRPNVANASGEKPGNVRLDFVSKNDKNEISLTDAKSSSTAKQTNNQKLGYPLIEQNGGVVTGTNGEQFGLPAGTQIPPTPVSIIRPEDLVHEIIPIIP